MSDKKGFIFRTFNGFDGLALHVETFKEWLDKLPQSKGGFVSFAIHDNPPKSVYPKTMFCQLDATPKEVENYLWEMKKPGCQKVPFGQWLCEHREEVIAKKEEAA